MKRGNKKAVPRKLNPLTQAEKRVETLMDNVEFIYGEVSKQDEEVVRAMIVAGASDESIIQAITIAAVNVRVERDDKMRYAFGCVRNLMMEDVA